jgi:2,4-dienoyl-CoA reductase (NADPH2)
MLSGIGIETRNFNKRIGPPFFAEEMSTREGKTRMSDKARFDKLLEPYHIGKVQTRNRIVKTAAGMSYQTDDYMNETSMAFYEGLAKGGVGLLMVESPAIDYPLSLMFPIQFRLDDDRFIPGFSELTKVIHKQGCPTFLQMWHCGQWQQKELFGLQGVAASAISRGSLGGSHLPMEVPRELSISEIEELVDKFASTAVRAQKAGFDGVEVNASSNHLLATFLSRIWNQRQDAYGGSLENRARFVLEIIREIKKRAGQDFPVITTINGVEIGEEGKDENRTYEEGQELARMLEEAGADALQIRFYWLGHDISVLTPEVLLYPEPHIPLKDFPKELDWSLKGAGASMPVAAAIKKAVSIPVITVGRLNAELGEEALRKGKVDFIGMCRRLMADPEMPNKLASGRVDDIRPCLACLQCMHGRPQPVPCVVNASLGKEREYTVEQAAKKKRVLVVGGGPAGMEAARVAALRGHEVILYEKERKLGGLLPLAAVVKGTEIEDLPALVSYLERQITRLGVKISLGKEVNLPVIEEIKPDVVILATGGIFTLPDIPGINGRNVVSGAKLHHSLKNYLRFLGPGLLRWLTRFWMPVGKSVVIIGGAIQGCELAEFLVKRGRRVTIVDTAGELGEGLAPEKKIRLLMWFPKKGVTMMTEVSYEEITDKGLTVITREGKRQTITADTVISSIPLIPNTDLLKSLEGKGLEIHAIGDCKEPRLIIDAIADGSRVAHAI